MKFTKMHGCGNDYVYVNAIDQKVEDPAKIAVMVSDRHFGIGSDGLILIKASDKADFEMQMFNADGSEGAMCGNGIRCVGKYVYDKGYTNKTELTVETLSGIKTLSLNVTDGKVKTVTVDMGRAVVSEELALEDLELTCTPVSVGNPHAVFFVDNAEAVPLATIGPEIERHTLFPGGVNAEFVQVISPTELRMRVWERGSGITMACGTGACASATAAVKKGLCPADTPITVRLDGGELEITVGAGGSVTMTGPAETVYEGETDIC